MTLRKNIAKITTSTIEGIIFLQKKKKKRKDIRRYDIVTLP